jgi:hypothetical protein
MCEILEFCQVGKFNVDGINRKPAINRGGNHHNPQNGHKNVIEEVQVVDNGKEQEGHKSKRNEDPIAPNPW